MDAGSVEWRQFTTKVTSRLHWTTVLPQFSMEVMTSKTAAGDVVTSTFTSLYLRDKLSPLTITICVVGFVVVVVVEFGCIHVNVEDRWKREGVDVQTRSDKMSPFTES